MRDRPLGADALGEFRELRVDRIAGRPGSRGILAGRLGRNRLRKAREVAERIIFGPGRCGLDTVEIEQSGIDALA